MLLQVVFFMMFCLCLLVEEIPAHTESEYSLVKWIVGRKEVVAVALTCIYVAHHYEEACVLQVEIGVYINQRIVAHLGTAGAGLNTLLSESWAIVGRIILGEVACIGTEVALKHSCNLESQIQIGVDIEIGHRYNVVV